MSSNTNTGSPSLGPADPKRHRPASDITAAASDSNNNINNSSCNDADVALAPITVAAAGAAPSLGDDTSGFRREKRGGKPPKVKLDRDNGDAPTENGSSGSSGSGSRDGGDDWRLMPLSSLARAAPYLYPVTGAAANGEEPPLMPPARPSLPTLPAHALPAATARALGLLPASESAAAESAATGAEAAVDVPVPVSERAVRAIAGEMLLTAQAKFSDKMRLRMASRAAFCADCDLPRPICVCPSVPDVSALLPAVAQVFVVTSKGEIAGKRNSNTGKWLLRAGARRVVVGLPEEEDAFTDAVLAAPVGSVMVLFPDPASVTVGAFLSQMADAAGVPEQQRVAVSGVAEDGSLVHSEQAGGAETAGLPLPPLAHVTAKGGGAGTVGSPEAPVTVILLDGTWGGARTLLRRLKLQVQSRGFAAVSTLGEYNAMRAAHEAYVAANNVDTSKGSNACPAPADAAAAMSDSDESAARSYQFKFPPISSSSAAAVAAAAPRPLLLPTVKLSRSFRGDVGSLRKLGRDGNGEQKDSMAALLTASGASTNAAATTGAAAAPASAAVAAEVDSVRGKVSTLHAFTVMVEELWGLGKSHGAGDAAAADATDDGADDAGDGEDKGKGKGKGKAANSNQKASDAGTETTAAAAAAADATVEALTEVEAESSSVIEPVSETVAAVVETDSGSGDTNAETQACLAAKAAGTVVVPALSALSAANCNGSGSALSSETAALLSVRMAAATAARHSAQGLVNGLLATLRSVVAAFHAHVGGRKNLLLPDEVSRKSGELLQRLNAALEEEKAARKEAKWGRRVAKKAAGASYTAEDASAAAKDQ